ncbi:MAG: hypothetical protein LBT89_03720 [Planctomycetaceae bacterium]|jgi:hypothetical protein|nr:hypothetical protein [Planctomycetaceae bacterium]
MQGWMQTLFSALVGGAVGAATVFFAGSNQSSLDSLTVGDLTIKNKAVLLNKEGKEDVVIKEGSVLANNIVLGKKFIGVQYQGEVFVGNRMFTTPDNLKTTPMEQWHFYTEIGSSPEVGGEFLVRGPNGANVVNQQNVNGITIRTGFNKESMPSIAAVQNKDRSLLGLAPFIAPKKPQDNTNANANTNTNAAAAGNSAFDSPATTPTAAQSKPAPAIATQPDAGKANLR